MESVLEPFNRPRAPTRKQVEDKLLDLIEGRSSREDLASWAVKYLVSDFQEGDDDDALSIEDPVVLSTIENLSAADLKVSDHSYFHQDTDFLAWLEDLRQPQPSP